MKFQYSQWRDDLIKKEMKFEDLLQLFNQLLLYTGGDVAEALQWLTHLDKEHQLFGDDYGMDDFVRDLEDRHYIEGNEKGVAVLTPKAERRIRQDSLDEIFSALKKSPSGLHETSQLGQGVERLSETRPYEFGDSPSSIDFSSTIRNAMKRSRSDDLSLREEDFEVFENEHLANCSTILAIESTSSQIHKH